MMILDPLLNLARDYEHLNIPGKEWQAEEETEVCSDFFFFRREGKKRESREPRNLPLSSYPQILNLIIINMSSLLRS